MKKSKKVLTFTAAVTAAVAGAGGFYSCANQAPAVYGPPDVMVEEKTEASTEAEKTEASTEEEVKKPSISVEERSTEENHGISSDQFDPSVNMEPSVYGPPSR